MTEKVAKRGIVGVGVNTYYAPFLAMIIGPLRHVALNAATRDRYYEPAHAGAKHGEIVKANNTRRVENADQ